MATISIKCRFCNNSIEVTRTPEIPEDVTSLECNFCPRCEDEAHEDYVEGYCYDPLPASVDPNQPSIFAYPF